METEMIWNLISGGLMLNLTFRALTEEKPSYEFVKVIILINIWIKLW